MKRAALESKDLLNPSEAIKHFGLSARKFYKLLDGNVENDFIVFYGKRRLIIRSAFEKYLQGHHELRRCR
ncbi:MAG: DNA-binding protein [Ruminococcus sp.]|nr:DNA-binding protein [Ruminococcus sp.]